MSIEIRQLFLLNWGAPPQYLVDFNITLMWLDWHVSAFKMAPGRNTPLGAESTIMRGLAVESNDWGNGNHNVKRLDY